MNKEIDDGVDIDYLYDDMKDRAIIGVYEEIVELFEAYMKNPVFKNNPDRLAKHILMALEETRLKYGK